VEDGGSQIGSVERVRRVLGEARASTEEEAWLGRGQASCRRPTMGAEGCGSAMEVQATSWKWSEDCGRELECTEECGKELG